MIANGIKRPIFTDVCVVCCCYNVALHLMKCRSLSPSTRNKFHVLWQAALEEKLQFAKDLVSDEIYLRNDETMVAAVLKVCKEIRGVQGKARRMIFLNAFFMTELNASQAKKLE